MTIEQYDRDAAKSILRVSTTIDDQEVIAATFAHIREQAAEIGGDDNGVFFDMYDRQIFKAILDQIERTDNAIK
jgi:hypothetical protein